MRLDIMIGGICTRETEDTHKGIDFLTIVHEDNEGKMETRSLFAVWQSEDSKWHLELFFTPLV
jgi:hypothetical protein